MVVRFRLLLCAVAVVAAACTTTTRPGTIGVTRQQLFLIPAEDVERLAAVAYAEQSSKARAAGRLLVSGPEVERLRNIATRVTRQSLVYRDDVRQWDWQLSLIDAPDLNATCAPGGKITFYTGLIRRLSLTDDEIAVVMGHEIAHALREHGREKVSDAVGQQLMTEIAAAASKKPEQMRELANQVTTLLFTLPNSREKETEADRMGLELMARAGYDPAAALSFWRKMSAAAGGSPPPFLSTHPSHTTRVNELASLQPIVRRLFEATQRR